MSLATCGTVSPSSGRSPPGSWGRLPVSLPAAIWRMRGVRFFLGRDFHFRNAPGIAFSAGDVQRESYKRYFHVNYNLPWTKGIKYDEGRSGGKECRASHTTHGVRRLLVGAFESRLAAEMSRLIEAHGGRPMVAPSMREIPLEENRERSSSATGFSPGTGTSSSADRRRSQDAGHGARDTPPRARIVEGAGQGDACLPRSQTGRRPEGARLSPGSPSPSRIPGWSSCAP